MQWNLKCIFINSTTSIFTNLSTPWDTNIKTAQTLRTSTYSMILFPMFLLQEVLGNTGRGLKSMQGFIWWLRNHFHPEIHAVPTSSALSFEQCLCNAQLLSQLLKLTSSSSNSTHFGTSSARSTAKEKDLQEETTATCDGLKCPIAAFHVITARSRAAVITQEVPAPHL